MRLVRPRYPPRPGVISTCCDGLWWQKRKISSASTPTHRGQEVETRRQYGCGEAPTTFARGTKESNVHHTPHHMKKRIPTIRHRRTRWQFHAWSVPLLRAQLSSLMSSGGLPRSMPRSMPRSHQQRAPQRRPLGDAAPPESQRRLPRPTIPSPRPRPSASPSLSLAKWQVESAREESARGESREGARGMRRSARRQRRRQRGCSS